MKRIGMVMAMTAEMVSAFSEFGDYVKETKKNRDVYIFSYMDKEIFMTQSGIGEIAAASAVQFLCDKYDIDVIINFGVVGALHKGLSIAELVAVKQVVHYDMDTSAIDNWEPCRYSGYESIYLSTSILTDTISKKCSLKQVICASGDKFIADKSIKETLHNNYNADICEMESAAIVLTADKNDIQVLCFKAVSDGDGGAMEYRDMVHIASMKFKDVLMSIMETL